jgi:Skp family chaperone for outer membrane proteins
MALVLALAPLVAPAQEDLSMGQVRSPILTIDTDRLLAETQYGRSLNEELRLRAEAFAAENERLRVQLTEEERRLTELRPTMEVDAFRAEAEAFDQRVQGIRAEQDAEERELNEAVSLSRGEFLNTVTPVLAQLMIDSGAAVLLERRQVILSAGLVEITDEAIAAIDAQIGTGEGAPAGETPGAGETPALDEAAPSGEAPAPVDGTTPSGGAGSTNGAGPLDVPDAADGSEPAPEPEPVGSGTNPDRGPEPAGAEPGPGAPAAVPAIPGAD